MYIYPLVPLRGFSLSPPLSPCEDPASRPRTRPRLRLAVCFSDPTTYRPLAADAPRACLPPTTTSDARKMYIHVPLLLFLLANAAPSDAALFSRDSESSLSRAARHVRRHVIKRSTGLLDDLRLAYTGIRLQQQQTQQKQQVLFQSSKMYCVNNGNTGLGIANNGTSGSSAPSSSDTGISPSASSTAASSLSSSSPTPTTSPTNAATTTTKAAATQSTSPATASPTATGSSSGSSSSPWKVAQSYVRCAFTYVYATI